MRTLKQALKTGEFSTTLTLEDLQEQGEDWRLRLEDLLLQDAIRLVWETDADSSDLKHHTSQYLNALSHFNTTTGHREGDVILRPTPTGEIYQSRKGEKPKSQQKSGRGRGRPPKRKDL